MFKNKFESNSKYYSISIYTIFVILASAIIFKLIFQWDTFSIAFGNFLKILSPFLIGLIIAYLVNPLVERLNYTILLKWFRVRNDTVRKIVSIFISYVIVFGLLILCIIYLLPHIVANLTDIIYIFQAAYSNLIIFVDALQAKYPAFNFEYIDTVIENALPYLMDVFKNAVSNLVPLIYNTSISILTWVINIFIAIMVSCYMLYDKRRILRGIKRLLYVSYNEDKAKRASNTLKECNTIFSGFIAGKIIDSLLVGILCFIIMSIFKLPYALLISVVIGTANLIPYFGPLIGAIPGILIMLMFSVNKALIFTILILVIQQIDALFIEPKILGDGTGLRPMWIIFAITIGGWIAGPLGMFLGVPFVAVIAHLCEKRMNYKLKLKGLEHLLENDPSQIKGFFKKK